MIVVSDTSPFSYLALLDLIELLPRLYGVVAIPRIVLEELLSPASPAKVRSFAEGMHSWLEVHDESVPVEGALADLDAGEAAAIALAERLKATLLLIDEKRGRAVARRRGLAVTGLLGLLAQAARDGLIDFDETTARLRNTNFRISETAIEAARTSLGLT